MWKKEVENAARREGKPENERAIKSLISLMGYVKREIIHFTQFRDRRRNYLSFFNAHILPSARQINRCTFGG